MTDKQLLLQNQALQLTNLELTATNVNYAVEVNDGDVERKARIQAANLTHNEEETNLSAVDAKMMDNKQGRRAQFTAVDMKAKYGKREISLTQIDVNKGTGTDKATVMAANVTRDAEGNTRALAMTNAGAGQTFNIPIKGSGGIEMKHEGTIYKQDEHGEEIFHVFTVSPYSAAMRAEKCKAIKKAKKFFFSTEIPRHVKLRIFWKTSLLLFYVFQFLYPLITFLVDRQYVLYNLVCIGIGLIGFLLQCLEFDQLYADLKDICGKLDCCKTCKCEECCSCSCECCSSPIRRIISVVVNEILLYATVICTLMGFINERTWELESFWSYVDCFLLLYSVLMDVLVPRVYYLRWLSGAISKLLKQYHIARNKVNVSGCNDCCTKYITPLRFTPVFVVFVIILHFSMLGSITVRIYADNFFGQLNITRNGTEYMEEVIRPEVGMYNVERHTWFTILGGIVVPFLSIATYFIINQYWLWQPLHYTVNESSGFVPQNSLIKSMSDADKWMIFAFDPIAWIFMVPLIASFITFCVFAAGRDYDSSVLDGQFPIWISATYILSYIFMCFSFLVANFQTVAFGLFIYVQPCCCFIVLLQCFRRPQYRVH